VETVLKLGTDMNSYAAFAGQLFEPRWSAIGNELPLGSAGKLDADRSRKEHHVLIRTGRRGKSRESERPQIRRSASSSRPQAGQKDSRSGWILDRRRCPTNVI
jgi:hypothetical protein